MNIGQRPAGPDTTDRSAKPPDGGHSGDLPRPAKPLYGAVAPWTHNVLPRLTNPNRGEKFWHTVDGSHTNHWWYYCLAGRVASSEP